MNADREPEDRWFSRGMLLLALGAASIWWAAGVCSEYRHIQPVSSIDPDSAMDAPMPFHPSSTTGLP